MSAQGFWATDVGRGGSGEGGGRAGSQACAPFMAVTQRARGKADRDATTDLASEGGAGLSGRGSVRVGGSGGTGDAERLSLRGFELSCPAMVDG